MGWYILGLSGSRFGKWKTVLNMVMNLVIPQNLGKILSS
jgi:hypothetical protein